MIGLKRKGKKLLTVLMLLPVILSGCLEKIPLIVTIRPPNPSSLDDISVTIQGDFPTSVIYTRIVLFDQTQEDIPLGQEINFPPQPAGTYYGSVVVIDNDLNVGTESLTIEVLGYDNVAPIVDILYPSSGTYPPYTSIVFGAYGQDEEDGSIPEEDYTWYINGIEVATGSSFAKDDFEPGQAYTIDVVVTDSQGSTGSDQITISINEPGEPQITILFVSEYGDSDGYLSGQVTGVNPAEYEIHGYGEVANNIWTKPYYLYPVTELDASGQFRLDFTTGGQDKCATAVLLYLVPKGTILVICDPCYEAPEIPETIVFTLVDRSPLQRTIMFAGEEWWVKYGLCLQGPGPNYFDNSQSAVWVDANGYLHMKIRNDNGVFKSSEVVRMDSTGFGTYKTVIKGRVDILDRVLIFAWFLWDYTAYDIYFGEMDIEFTTWNNLVTDTNVQFVVQPCSQCPGCQDNCVRFPVELTDQEDELTLYMIWQSGQIEFRVYKGDYSNTKAPESALVYAWTKTEGVPDPGYEAIHYNFWQFMGADPSDGLEREIIIKYFSFQEEIIEFPHCEDSCDDSNECTDDFCDDNTGCVNTPNTDPCDDNDQCTTNDTCINSSCLGGSALNCDDENICTDDSCDSEVGCINSANSALCDDNNECTVNDVCSGGSCLGGSTLNCDDNNECTDDSCHPNTGCISTPNADDCDDGNECTENDTCSQGICAGILFECGECGIQIIDVSPYDTYDGWVWGIVRCYSGDLYAIAVYIKVRGRWWTKPHWAWPVTSIEDDGTWRCDIVTGGVDYEATEICAFLISQDYDPPSRGGHSSLPQELYDNALEWDCVERTAE